VDIYLRKDVLMKTNFRKGISILLSVLIVFNLLLGSPFPAFAATPENIVQWTSVSTITPGTTQPATGGINISGAVLQTTFGGTIIHSVTNGYAAASTSWSTGDTRTPPSGWAVSFSTLNYSSLQLSLRSRGSPTAPRDWKVQYSTDNITWSDVTAAAYQSTSAGVNVGPFSLPVEAENQATLYLRMVMSDNVAIKSTSTTTFDVGTDPNCTSNINNIAVSGTIIPVTPTPTDVPTITPTDVPTQTPTDVPTQTPTDVPTQVPTDVPTITPTDVPTITPTGTPTGTPTPVAGYNVYFGQLHSHTNLSDGAGSVDQAFSHASIAANLDFLAITDHSNSFELSTYTAGIATDAMSNTSWATGKNAALAITTSKIGNSDNVTDPASTFVGIYAYEMTWSDGAGHMNTFNTPGFENRNNPVFKNKAQSLTDPSGLAAYYSKLATVSGAIAQFNHPGSTFGDFYDFANYSAVNDARITLIEVGNGEGAVHASGYFPSYSYYTRALDKGWHVAPTNNQDNHKGGWGDANTARTVILATELTETSLYDALRNRCVYATEDNDLSIVYKLNGEIMGSILGASPTQVNITAQISDPTDASIGTVEVIVNGGLVAASTVVTGNSQAVSFTLDNDYTYYYLRITQPDTDTAVTAPVWTSDIEHAGISSISTDTALPVKGESLAVTTALFNNEATALTVNSLVYSIDGQVVKTINGSDLAGGTTVAALGTQLVKFDYIPTTLGSVDLKVTLSATLGGVDKIYSDVLKLNVTDPSTVTKVLIDGTHLNDYVNGYYSGNMTNFITLCASEGIQARIENTAITPEMLADTDLLIVTAPLKYVKGMTPQEFSPAFNTMVADYVKNGGTAILCGLADYQDNSLGDPNTSTRQINDLLKAMGAATTINSDEVCDAITNEGTAYRLKLSNYNAASPWLIGATAPQRFNVYSGCSVNPASAGDYLIKGHTTTYSINSKVVPGLYESPVAKNGTVIPEGEVCAVATEAVGSGRVFVSGTVFFSNFDVPANANTSSDLQLLNYTLIQNILDSKKTVIPVTSIADVRAHGLPGQVFAVEGIVTAGSEQPTAFFDAIYIQDATGGINIFPIANGSGILVGQKIRVVGHVDSYQGDMELKIGTGVEGYTILDTTINPVVPTDLTTAAAMNYSRNGGRLVRITGQVSDIVISNGNVVSFVLTDDNIVLNAVSGTKARVFVDGYITSNISLVNLVKDGDYLSAVGLVYANPDGISIRVRDRVEIITAAAPLTPTPTAIPTAAPTAGPTAAPTAGPIAEPTAGPTAAPTAVPTAPTSTPASTATPIPTTGTGVLGADKITATSSPTPATAVLAAAKTGEKDAWYVAAFVVLLVGGLCTGFVFCRTRREED